LGFLQPRRRSPARPPGWAEDPNQGSMQHCRDCTLGRPHSGRPCVPGMKSSSEGFWNSAGDDPGTEPARSPIPSSERCGGLEGSSHSSRPGCQSLLRKGAVVRKVQTRGTPSRPCLIHWSYPRRIWIGGDGFGCFHREGIPAGMIELEQGSGDW
jgi:hypothetical protein